jgi:two-component system, NtrC family, sensor kinase
VNGTPRRATVRLLLLLELAALAAAVVAVVLGLGLPLLARGALSPRALGLVVGLAALALVGFGALLLFRAVARPVERLLAAAERLGADAGLPLLGPPGEREAPGLGRAAIAFERLAGALGEERARLARKITELERTNAELARAEASLVVSERLATVGRLASGIAHEVGNPLGAISGYVELARGRVASGAPAAEVDDFLSRMGAETERIDRIVRDLLDFARPSPPAPAPTSVAAALDSALRLARLQPRFKSVEVELALADDLPLVLADERRLGQVFLNLLLNAGDAMAGQGEVRITAARGSDAVDVTIADRGPGIPEADRGRVFDPFFTTKEPGRGTGLGLAICHGIMASFGGGIAAGARTGGGAELTLTFREAGAPPAAW